MLGDQSFLQSSINMAASPDQRMRGANMGVQIPMPQKGLDIGTKVYNAKNYIQCILSLITDSSRVDNGVRLLPESKVEELKLKMTGAFERLEMVHDEYQQGEQLVNVFANFVGDIAEKL